MEEKDEILFEDDIEILDFDDDIIEESPEIEEIIIEDIEPIQEIVKPDIKENIEIVPIIEDIKENNNNVIIDNVSKNVIDKPIVKEQCEDKTINEEINSIKTEDPIIQKEIKNDTISNTDLLNNTLRINKDLLKETPSDNTEEEKPLNEDKISNETTVKVKRKVKWKSVIIGILIFVLLFGVIIALPFISDHVNRKENKQNNIKNNETNIINEDFKSNINVKDTLQAMKEYKNYKYQNINTISTKDNTEQLITVKNNYTYIFNETKFEVSINKVVVDFTYDAKDYYEKLDDVYNLYVNDITTKTYTNKNITAEEFNGITNMFPNLLEYIINNYNLDDEKLIKVGNEEHINITLKVPKEVVNNMSVVTDRIQNKIDVTKLENDFIYVDLLFDESKKLYKIEIEIEDKNACQEQLENEVESAILRYIFTDFNKMPEVTLPN